MSRSGPVNGDANRDLKAVCIDLDGTLIDTGPLHVEAERLALISLGVPEQEHDHPATFGTGVLPGLQTLADHYGFPSAEHVMEAYLPAWESVFESRLEPMPGAEGLLKRLQTASIPTALVTSGENDYVEKVLARFGWASAFQHRVTLESVTNLKPHPEAYLTAANMLGLKPGQCAGIEDSPSGLSALTAAGLFSVFVNRDKGMVDSAVGADLSLDSLESFDGTLIDRLFTTEARQRD